MAAAATEAQLSTCTFIPLSLACFVRLCHQHVLRSHHDCYHPRERGAGRHTLRQAQGADVSRGVWRWLQWGWRGSCFLVQKLQPRRMPCPHQDSEGEGFLQQRKSLNRWRSKTSNKTPP